MGRSPGGTLNSPPSPKESKDFQRSLPRRPKSRPHTGEYIHLTERDELMAENEHLREMLKQTEKGWRDTGRRATEAEHLASEVHEEMQDTLHRVRSTEQDLEERTDLLETKSRQIEEMTAEIARLRRELRQYRRRSGDQSESSTDARERHREDFHMTPADRRGSRGSRDSRGSHGSHGSHGPRRT